MSIAPHSNASSLGSSVMKDPAVQSSAAGLVIALVVAVAKKMIFPTA
jgi:hypothetical protein